MWQAISRLLSEQLGEGEIELRNELPGGEIHAAWHLRYAGRDFFVKCDERELLTGFTAEADQLELLSRSQTVSVPKVWAVGADRDYSSRSAGATFPQSNCICTESLGSRRRQRLQLSGDGFPPSPSA